ncbi:peptidoglycan-binding domain-containing protein [Lentzea sp. NPDC054927]
MFATLKRTGLALVLTAAAVLTGATAAEAGPVAAAEVACDSYTHVAVPSVRGWYLHVPSLGSNSGNYNCVVVRGHRGFPVLVLQESLFACYGQYVGPNGPDGDFGGNTEHAVKNAQARINQPSVSKDGRFGPKTSQYFLFQAYDHNNGGRHTSVCYRR